MRVRTTVLAAALVFATGSTWAHDHLVTTTDADARLREAALAQAEARASLGRVLASSDAERTAAGLGIDIRDVRAAAGTLSDAEARDLARRVDALRADPAAGLSSDVDHLLVIFLIVAIVILVLQAVD
jgi:methionine-rich copper-binding protein CopC